MVIENDVDTEGEDSVASGKDIKYDEKMDAHVNLTNQYCPSALGMSFYAEGILPPELAKIMEFIPPKKMFLRTAQQRKGVPEEWLVKNPHELMRAMYAIDLRYVHLQEALHRVEPYLKAVKEYIKMIT